MHVGIGLPTTTPGTDRSLLMEWCKRADNGSFKSLGVIDRLLYNGYDPMASLAAAAVLTSSVRLVTMVLAGPLRNTAILAKEAATIDHLSGGRLTLGLAIGARADDYRAAGVDTRKRGEGLTEQLSQLRDIWDEAKIGPDPVQTGGPDLLIGGSAPEALLRMARYSDGYVHGGGPARSFASAVSRVRAAWEDLRRPGEPQLWAQAYFTLGDVEKGNHYLADYYAFTGAFADRIVEGNLTTENAIADYIRSYREAGCHHLVLLPTVSDINQLDRLAEVVG